MFQSLIKQLAQHACRNCIELRVVRASSLRLSGIKLVQSTSFHTSLVQQVLDKDVKGKKELYKSSRDLKFEDTSPVTTFSDEEEQEHIVDGLIDSGLLIPTLETHEMLVNGVQYKELPIAYIRSTRNNTIITVTDYTNVNILGHSSCGMEGFRNVKKSTNVAAQATGLSVGYKVHRQGTTHVRVIVKGLGAGRLPAIKGLQQGGLNIVSITDNTAVFSNGPKPRKAKKM